MQVFDDAFADRFAFDVLDPTKIIPEEELPVRVVGRLVLDRMVDNFFAETEQVAFCPQNIIPGIDFTNDPLLQGRNFSYLDTQSSGSADPTSPISRSTRRVARSTTSSRTGTCRCAGRKGGRTTSRTPGPRAGHEPTPSAASAAFPSGQRREAQASRRELRRPLQPGAALLPQPDAGGAAAHRRRHCLRALEGGNPGDPRTRCRSPAPIDDGLLLP